MIEGFRNDIVATRSKLEVTLNIHTQSQITERFYRMICYLVYFIVLANVNISKMDTHTFDNANRKKVHIGNFKMIVL